MTEHASAGEWRVEPDPTIDDWAQLWRGGRELHVQGPVDELRAIAAAMNARAWRPMSEAPEDPTEAILLRRGTMRWVGYWGSMVDAEEWSELTPLPPPPEDAP